MFDPSTEVKHFELELKGKKLKKAESFPCLNVLFWQKEGKYFAHCLELDIIGQADNPDGAKRELAELLVMQIDFSEKNKTELYHPAPKEYWNKLHEIQANEIRQRLHADPPRSVSEVLRSFQPVYA
jgi:hypothetical protein